MRNSSKYKFRLLIFAFFLAFTAFVSADEIDSLKERYIQSILNKCSYDQNLIKELRNTPLENVVGDQMVIELMERFPITKSQIDTYLSTLQADGSWADFDFKIEGKGWQPKNHCSRIYELAKVYRDDTHPYFKSKEVEDAIHKSLNYYFTVKPVSSNWWYNEIGIPKILGAVFVLFEDKLTPTEMEGAMYVMAKIRETPYGLTGQNKVWQAGNLIVKGLLQKDWKLIETSRDEIASEIKIAYGKSEGIKVDFSYHQHGPMQQLGNYGAAYIATISFWANVLGHSTIRFEDKDYAILHNLISEGYRRILWKGYMDVNCLGRQFFYNTQIHKFFSSAFSINALSEVDPIHKDEYKLLIAENLFDKQSKLDGQYHFWKSDMTVQRCPNWMASLKMSSERTIGTENGGDNRRGYYLADGALYTYVNGNEYHNIYPCWDWRKIPGVTAYESDKPLRTMKWLEKQNQQAFVGNVNDGETGITAMDLSRDGLNARKAWVFTNDYIVCLGSGIKSDSSYVVTTSVEQSIQGGDLLHLNNNKWEKTQTFSFGKGEEHRFFHNNIGYILQNVEGKAFVENRTGNWRDIMIMYSDAMKETKDVFSLYVNHGSHPKNESYQYIILPATTQKSVQHFNVKDISVIQNTENAQIIKIGKATYLLALYSANDIQLDSEVRFKSDKPGIFMIKKQQNSFELLLSDATQKEESINIWLNGKQQTVQFPTGENRGTITSLTLNQ